MFEGQQSSLDPCIEGPFEMVDRPVVLLHGEDRRTSFQQPFREHTGSRSDLEDPRSAQITCEFQGSLQHSCVRQEVLSKVSVWCMETEERIDVGGGSGHGPTALGSLDADFLSDDLDDRVATASSVTVMRLLAMTARTSSGWSGMISASFAAISGYFSRASRAANRENMDWKTSGSVLIPFRFSLAAHSAWNKAAFCS